MKPLDPLGWLIMIVSLTSVISLTTYCLYRVLALPPDEIGSLDVAPLDIATPDLKDPG